MAGRDQLDLLIKLLKLSTSPNDAEALAASRKANALLVMADWQWETLLRGKVTIIADPFDNIAPSGPSGPSAQPSAPAPSQWKPRSYAQPSGFHSPPPQYNPPPQPRPKPAPKPPKPRRQRATLADLGL